MSRFLEETIKRQLREYYNEAMEIDEQVNEEELDANQAEKALIQLDEKYAKLIVKEME